MKREFPMLNTGALLDIPTGKFCGDEILNGGAVLPSHFGTGYPRNTGHSYHMFNLINESLRKTAPETTERYRLAAMLFKVMGLGVTWEDESIAPTVSWFDLEGGMEYMSDLIKDILTKDYAKELAEQELVSKELADKLRGVIAEGLRPALQQSVTDQVFGAGTVIQEHTGSDDNVATKDVPVRRGRHIQDGVREYIRSMNGVTQEHHGSGDNVASKVVVIDSYSQLR